MENKIIIIYDFIISRQTAGVRKQNKFVRNLNEVSKQFELIPSSSTTHTIF